MARNLDVPPELLHLIEKRESSDRRKAPRQETATNADQKPKPVQEDRRGNVERRQKARRASDRETCDE
ncbi:MAG: hypothetical protein ACC645_04635 [Pirellulales bacterium]